MDEDNTNGQLANAALRHVAAGAGQLAQTKITRDLLAKVASSTNAYLAKTEKLHKLGIELRPLWKRNFKIVTDSVDALDKTRADAWTLLCEKSTEANTERLLALDKVATMHLKPSNAPWTRICHL